MRDEVTVVVATIAFGMGIDKSNVRWVVHGDLPRSVEGYYQETGRAARDGEDADTLLLYGPRDIASIRWHIGNVESAGRAGARRRRGCAEILRYVESSACRRTLLLAHFDEHHPGRLRPLRRVRGRGGAGGHERGGAEGPLRGGAHGGMLRRASPRGRAVRASGRTRSWSAAIIPCRPSAQGGTATGAGGSP